MEGYNQKTLNGETITDEEIIIKRLEKVKDIEKLDMLAEKYPMQFAEYCHRNCKIRYKTYLEPKQQPKEIRYRNPELEKPQPDNLLVCGKQLKERFGVTTKNMIAALMVYDSNLKEEEAVNAYIW